MIARVKVFLKENYRLILISILIALFAHSYFIYKDFTYDNLMVGTADQTHQMVLFKDYLYKQFSEGNFFYSFTFNGGGNFFTNLSYYYSTSMVYYLTVLITYILESIGILSNIGVSYWANTIIIISIFRMGLILFLTTKLIEYFNVQRPIALFGSAFYAISVIYFRHVTLWEFFADAMIWLPILILGAEKIINNETGLIFSIGVFLALFNNPYFAYQSFLFLLAYIGLRFFVRLETSELPVLQQIKRYFIYGILGMVMALPGFIPFLLGFLNTSRLSPDFDIPWTNFQLSHTTNFLFNDNTFIIPFIFIVLALTFYLYKNKKFAFFSIMSIVLIILRFNPMLASIMNGFSYPQYRWPYILYLFIAIAIGIGTQDVIKNLSNQKVKNSLLIATLLTCFLYIVVYQVSEEQIGYSFTKWILIAGIVQTIVIVLFIYTPKPNQKVFLGLSLLLSFVTIFVSNRQLYHEYGLRKGDYFFERYDNENNKFQQALNFIEKDTENFYRIDYFEGINHSLPYEISTFNLYSSFHNQNQQFFERNFQILSDRDSNGEYSGLGKRKILNSLFQVDYMIAPRDQAFRVPVGYKEIASFEDLNVYKNDKPLDFIHPVRDIYNKSDFSSETFKDELILSSVITEDVEYNKVMRNNQSLLNDLFYELDYQNIIIEGDRIKTSRDSQLVIKIDEENFSEMTAIMLEYTLEPVHGQARDEYFINDFLMSLNGARLPYSEQRYRNRIPIHDTTEIVFRFQDNKEYYFKIHNVHAVNEGLLQARIGEDKNLDYEYEIEDDNVKVSYNNNDNYPIMVLPIFNELGWELKINGEKSDIINVNSGMIGFEIPNGQVEIELRFKQPYFEESLIMAVLAILILVFLERKRKQHLNH